MAQYTLTVVDTVEIQKYIFGTNNLRQNVGASYLVECATRKWAVEALPEPHNVVNLDKGEFTDEVIEDGKLKAELVYAGGGNTVILFASRQMAVDFARTLTRQILLQAPRLQVVLVHKDFDWRNEPLGGYSGMVKRAMEDLAARKWDSASSVPILGLGVTASCVFTGLPAVGQDQEGRLVSSEAEAKIGSAAAAHTRLQRLIDFRGYDLPKDFDDFGRAAEESSYIAVVHTDGNGMTERLQRIGDKFPTARGNRGYVEAMRAFSFSVQRAGLSTLQSTVNRLVASVRVEADGEKVIGGKIKLNGNMLPFRPIVFGGDDVTFVCDGRLGLSLAAHYLEEFSRQTLSDGGRAYSRAGVAVVKTHYPFARAYALAEELCRSAKEYIKERQRPPYNEEGLAAMDWHFAVSGLVRGLADLREREYTVPAGKLLMRPIRLTDQERDWRCWTNLRSIVQEFQAGEDWAERRNKIKALRDALRAGPDAVQNFRLLHALSTLPLIPERPEMAIQGWQAERCGYFDAIEAMEFFEPLEGGDAV